jgi:hypothetical protein
LIAGSKPVERNRPKVLEYAQVRMGVPLGISALGVTIIALDGFAWGVFLLYFGLALLAIDVAYEEFFKKWSKWTRIAVGITYLALIIAASHVWIYRPDPIAIWATSSVPTYGPGSNIHGVKWDSKYSGLNFYIKNPTSMNYDNFEAEIVTDRLIADLREIHGLSDCKIASAYTPFDVHWQHMQDGQPVGPADDPSVSYDVIPLDERKRSI